ncbi:MAG: ATP-binding protein [Gammaproteobacteria bacterium]|nr:ATP-binding protein [Gammaproteobacteria bacterium]
MVANELDLTPDPRVLQMLGEINLHQWRCLAELIDNSIDGFLHAARSGNPIELAQIDVNMPGADNEDARVTVKDNGPGMSLETLENAVKAGWTGNDPLSNLGLFGMGFNIATARLGLVTEVWTTRAGDREYVGVRIDLDELRATRNFRVPRLTRPKQEDEDHGTEIVISRLKPDQRRYLARGNNRTWIRKQLARAYSALLANSTGSSTKLTLNLNDNPVEPRRHCTWDETRSVSLPDGTDVKAVEFIDLSLAPRRFCTYCMRTLASDEENCPTASSSCRVEETPRRLKGWVGIQRYLDNTAFGIDFIRNGRKIEIGNKDLFVWSDDENPEVEYPIDDPRTRGRFVGEIHIDHCRVSYTKDRFERDDPSWNEMVRVVRGDGPLRPRVASQRGYAGNHSPLYRLFQAFRRSSPQGKNGLWSRILVVKDNDHAKQMADNFAAGKAEYRTDELWWNLVEEQDKEIVGGPPDTDDPPEIPGGIVDEPEADPGGGETDPAQPPPPPRRALHELTRKYSHPTYRVEYEIQAFAVQPDDPDLLVGTPWVFYLDDVATRTYVFLVNIESEMFRSTTMTPLDGLLTELAHRTVDFLKEQAPEVTIAGVLADFRRQYCISTRLDPQEIIPFATTVLEEIANAIPGLISPGQGTDLYADLTDTEKEAIAQRMANRSVLNHNETVAEGDFWSYADFESLRGLFRRHPELFLDGNYWEDAYETLDYGTPQITDDARAAVVSRYDAYLGDAVWLANQTSGDLERTSRDMIIRATCSLRLLRPDLAE